MNGRHSLNILFVTEPDIRLPGIPAPICTLHFLSLHHHHSYVFCITNYIQLLSVHCLSIIGFGFPSQHFCLYFLGTTYFLSICLILLETCLSNYIFSRFILVKILFATVRSPVCCAFVAQDVTVLPPSHIQGISLGLYSPYEPRCHLLTSEARARSRAADISYRSLPVVSFTRGVKSKTKLSVTPRVSTNN